MQRLPPCVRCLTGAAPMDWRSIPCRWACRPTCPQPSPRVPPSYVSAAPSSAIVPSNQSGAELKIAFIGGGNMAAALIGGLVGKVAEPANVHVVDLNAEALQALKS